MCGTLVCVICITQSPRKFTCNYFAPPACCVLRAYTETRGRRTADARTRARQNYTHTQSSEAATSSSRAPPCAEASASRRRQTLAIYELCWKLKRARVRGPPTHAHSSYARERGARVVYGNVLVNASAYTYAPRFCWFGGGGVCVFGQKFMRAWAPGPSPAGA